MAILCQKCEKIWSHIAHPKMSRTHAHHAHFSERISHAHAQVRQHIAHVRVRTHLRNSYLANFHSRILNFHDKFQPIKWLFPISNKNWYRWKMGGTKYCLECLHTWIVWPSWHQGGYGWSHKSYIWNSLFRKEQFEGVRVSVTIDLCNYLEEKKMKLD